MEEIDALRAKAIASMSASANPNSKPSNRNLIPNKEEGELDSSDDEELPINSVAQLTSATPMFPADPDPVGPRKALAQASNAGKHLIVNGPLTSAGVQPQVPSVRNYNKQFEMKPSKPSNLYIPGQSVPSEAKDNLVINFDESDSDSEESQENRIGITLDRKDIAVGPVGLKRPDVSLHTKSILPKAVDNRNRVMPKKIPSSRAFTSAISKINKPNSRGFGASSVEREAYLQKPDSFSKTLSRQKHQFVREVNTTTSEVENLRQRIANREHELRRKPVSQIKERVSVSDDDSRITVPTSVTTLGLLIEPEKKRLKTGDPSCCKLNLDGQLQQLKLLSARESNSDLKNKVLDAKQKSKDNELTSEGLNSSNTLEGSYPSIIFQNKSAQQHDLFRSSTHNTVTSHDGIVQHTSSSTLDGFLHHGNLSNYYNQLHLSVESSSMNIQSLLKDEELKDKELEKAQEHRRKCELEERSALKAYRKSQRALIEANERCVDLYRQRELSSAHIRACIMGDSSSTWPSRWHKHREIGFDIFRNAPKANVNLVPGVSRRIQPEYELLESDIHRTVHGPESMSFQHMNLPRLGGPNPRCELNATSEPLSQTAANAVVNHSSQPQSADEDTFSSDHKGFQSNLASESKEESLRERSVVPSEEVGKKSSIENVQDSALLEASLRSELFARLGIRALANTSGLDINLVCTNEGGGSRYDENKKSHLSMPKLSNTSDQQFLVAENMAFVEDTEEPERIHDSCQYEKFCSEDRSPGSMDLEESSSSLKKSYRPSSASVLFLPSSDVKIVFRHLKLVLSGSSNVFQTGQNGISSEEAASVEETFKEAASVEETFKEAASTEDLFNEDAIPVCVAAAESGKLDSTSGSPAMDPFWPHCMFELRGKCNNDECSSQHARDYHRRNSKQIGGATNSDGQVGPASAFGKCFDARGMCLHLYIVPVPTYRVGKNLIKADSSGYVLARSAWQYWHLGFCTSFAIPLSVQRILPVDVPYLHADDAFMEDHGRWNSPSFYHNQNGAMIQPVQGLGDPEQSLEIAFDLFNRDANKQEGKKQALSILSRSLEVSPNSVGLWVVYLHMFYRKEKAIGKDDMFLLAVQLNEDSYELWLLYINSRIQLNERLEAYDAALKAFICISNSPNKDIQYTSSCLVDLFLQMIDFLSMSRNTDEAISRVYGLVCPATEFQNCSKSTVSDILACLTIREKCIFWVCVTYFLVYKKLPESVVQRLEFEQELPFGIEWPAIQLTPEEKDRAIELMKMAVDKMGITGDMCMGNHVDEVALRSTHSLALNHVKCVAALEGFENSKDLLVKYRKLYPTCLELSLAWARLGEYSLMDDTGSQGFEKALHNWPKEIPGIQCIWNQYAEFALEYERVGLVEKLMIRWFQSVWDVQNPGSVKFTDGPVGSDGSSEILANPDACFHSNLREKLFGLFNLSLHHLLQNNQVEAQVTMDEALKLAAAEDFTHCVKAHATFKLLQGFDLIKDSPGFVINYLKDVRASTIPEPLSRRFFKNIKKPKVRHLISNLLGPVSLDPALLNSVLEVWYGPSLLPGKPVKLKDLVDFVEFLMVIRPANYQLALSLCKVVHGMNLEGIASGSVMFWASSLLVNSIFQAFPVAPEWVWVEAAGVLGRLEIQGISERFHQLAVSVYPFSVKLWKSYFNLCKTSGNVNHIVKAARERGITLI